MNSITKYRSCGAVFISNRSVWSGEQLVGLAILRFPVEVSIFCFPQLVTQKIVTKIPPGPFFVLTDELPHSYRIPVIRQEVNVKDDKKYTQRNSIDSHE